jgi:hypothetical protein
MLAFPTTLPLPYTKMCGAHLVMLGKEANEHRSLFKKLLNYSACHFLLFSLIFTIFLYLPVPPPNQN